MLLASGGPQMASRNACRLQELVISPPLANGNLELVAAASGRRRIILGGDRDPITPLDYGGASIETRTPLDSAAPANVVAGCPAQVQVSRLVTADGGSWRAKSQYYVVTGVLGQLATGELCDRVKYLRQVSGEAILELFDIPVAAAERNVGDGVGVRLDRWITDDTFRARIGRLELDIKISDQPQLVVSLVGDPAQIAALVAERAAAAPATVPAARAAPPATPASNTAVPREPEPPNPSRIATRASESLIYGTRVAVKEYYEAAGQWPSRYEVLSRLAGPRTGEGVERVSVEDGTVVIEFSALAPELRGKRLAVRPMMTTGSAVYWVCGYESPPPGSFDPPSGPAARVATTVDRAYLPPRCR